MIVGDLGSQWRSNVVERLEQSAELTHAFAHFADNANLPYTRIEQGQTAAPDAILLSNGLSDQLVTVKALHINADFPIIDPNDPTAIRVTHNDPLIIALETEN